MLSHETAKRVNSNAVNLHFGEWVSEPHDAWMSAAGLENETLIKSSIF